MYFDYILESEDTVLTDKVIENATYEACLAYGEEFMDHVEDYINLLEDNDHEPTQEFDNFIFENLSPYLENESKYMLTFLDGTADEDADAFSNRGKTRQTAKKNKTPDPTKDTNSTAAFDAQFAKRQKQAQAQAQAKVKESSDARDKLRTGAQPAGGLDRSARMRQANQSKMRGQQLKNTNLKQSMAKGLQKAKMAIGSSISRNANKLAGNKFLGKAASAVGSAGKKMALSGATGRRNLNRTMLGNQSRSKFGKKA